VSSWLGDCSNFVYGKVELSASMLGYALMTLYEAWFPIHYYANAERKHTQGLAYWILNVRKQYARRKKITQAKKQKLQKKRSAQHARGLAL